MELLVDCMEYSCLPDWRQGYGVQRMLQVFEEQVPQQEYWGILQVFEARKGYSCHEHQLRVCWGYIQV